MGLAGRSPRFFLYHNVSLLKIKTVLLFFKDLIYLCIFRERGREEEKRERNINVYDKHRLVASHMHPDQGPNPQSRHVP